MTMRKPWIVIACAAFIVTLAMGVRQAFGLFLPPMSVSLGIGRESFGLAIAISNLVFGLAQPFIGALGDRHGAGQPGLRPAAHSCAGHCCPPRGGGGGGAHRPLLVTRRVLTSEDVPTVADPP